MWGVDSWILGIKEAGGPDSWVWERRGRSLESLDLREKGAGGLHSQSQRKKEAGGRWKE